MMRTCILWFALSLFFAGCGDPPAERDADTDEDTDVDETRDADVDSEAEDADREADVDEIVDSDNVEDSDIETDGDIETSPVAVDGFDLLLVIDDSGGMVDEQIALTEAIDDFFSTLEATSGGLPDLHVAAVTTSMGTFDHFITYCEDSDDGIMQRGFTSDSCGMTSHFLHDVERIDGTRERNYTGSLSDAIGCVISSIGTRGCGFEQPLEAMRRALDGSNPENAGFLRDDAALVVLIVSDEDDCSASSPDLFDPRNDDLGPLSSFRCFSQGVVCNPDDTSTTGTRSDCRPREDSEYLFPVGDYIEFLREIKPSAPIYVSAIAGDPEPVEIVFDSYDMLALDYSCGSTEMGDAVPAVRINALVEAFSAETGGGFESVCTKDYGPILSRMALDIGELLP